jgi:multiple sugar transport system permease protein
MKLSSYGNQFQNAPVKVSRWVIETSYSPSHPLQTAGYALAQLPIRGSKAILAYFIVLMMVPFPDHPGAVVPDGEVGPAVRRERHPGSGRHRLARHLVGADRTARHGATVHVPLAMAPLFTFLARQYYVGLPSDLVAAARRRTQRVRHLLSDHDPTRRTGPGHHRRLRGRSSWNAFLWPLIVTSSDDLRPIQVGLAIFSQDPLNVQWPYLMAGATLAAIPMIVLFLVAQRRFVEGMANAGLKDEGREG